MSMISIKRGNIFSSKSDCIVNTINCVGFMGKGIALEISIRYPEIEKIYKEKCELHEIDIGSLWLYNPNDDSKKVLNFPTKYDFKYPSKVESLEKGLVKFRNEYHLYDIKSIAFPLLGAQNGGIGPELSLNIMKKYLGDLTDINIEVYIFDKANYQKDELFKKFLSYLDENSSDKKICRIKTLLHEKNDIYTFSDIVEKKISVEQEDGSYKKSSIATKQYLQKIISNIKAEKRTRQASIFDAN